MRKKLDDLFSILMPLAAIGVVLAGAWVLSHSIDRANSEPAPIPVAALRLDPPVPAPAPEPAGEIPLYIYHPGIPLGAELQAVWHDACAEAGAPEALALGDAFQVRDERWRLPCT